VLTALESKDRLKGLSYCLVEKGPGAREKARRRLSRFPRVKLFEDLASFEHTAGVCGCVFSNEFFDALPFHRVVQTAEGLRELWVAAEEERLVERPGELSSARLAGALSSQGVALAEGQRAEVCLALDEAMADVGRTLGQGFVLSIDYGEQSLDLYRETRINGTLQVYAKHRAEDDPFAEIGERDITAHVDFGRLAALGEKHDLRPLVYCSQGAYLLSSAEDVLRRVVETDRTLAAATQQLVHPESFGGRFNVLVQAKNVAHVDLPGGKVNRVRRLAPAAAISS
jgi:SAM-dependent MidA family methyltransferase